MMKEWLKKARPHRRGMVAGVMSLLLLLSQPPAPALAAVLICGQTAHEHSAECYTPVLTCELEEHRHSVEDGCYTLTCTEVEAEAHTHGKSCYTLACGETEAAGHTHDGGCYDEDGALICSQEERDAHTHSENCYELACGEEESAGHAHSIACYDLICDRGEHTHDEGCYTAELTCQLSEHIHTGDCYEPDLPGSVPDDPVPNAPPVFPEPSPNAPPELPAWSYAEPDEAEDGLNGTDDEIIIEPSIPADDPAFLKEPEHDVTPYSVDVEWGAMTFWYVTQGWDAKAMRADTSLTGWHVYDRRADLPVGDCAINAITVQNLSESAEITAVFSYSGTYDFGIYDGDFTRNFIALSPRETCEVHFMPRTVPDGALTSYEHSPMKIGTITVDIKPVV